MSIGLAADNLIMNYDAPGGGTLLALGPISFEISPGQFVCLVGPSGCGKSTLIRVFAGLHRPSRGTATLGGEPVTGPSPRVGLMFQQANLMPWRTVLDNVALPLELAGMPKDQRYETANRLLTMLDLVEFERAYPGELSGGMAQRAALGRVLVQQPDVLLLDEPFGALDALTRERVSADMLRVWAQQRQTVLMVTHDIREAVFLADRVLVLSRRPGRITADIRVSLPRPRTLEQTYEPEFAQTAREVRAAIDEN
jgi:NitT/TauT family transport system ATP-binding protein